MDYVFDWTILKYQQTQRSKSQLELPVSTFITSFFGRSIVFLGFKILLCMRTSGVVYNIYKK